MGADLPAVADDGVSAFLGYLFGRTAQAAVCSVFSVSYASALFFSRPRHGRM